MGCGAVVSWLIGGRLMQTLVQVVKKLKAM